MIDVNSWIPVPDFPNYEIYIATNEVKSLNYNHTWKVILLKPYITKFWYIQYSLWWRKKTYCFHQIVARIKYGYWALNGMEVCHSDWNSKNNHPDNLRYWTRSENYFDKVKHWNHHMKWKFWKLCPYSKPVLQYSKHWEFIKEWDSVVDIKIGIWISNNNISSCCRWKRKSAGWFIWKYKN